jgi:hypothetical protein
MTDLDGTDTPTELAPGITLTAPGVVGTAELEHSALSVGRGPVPTHVSDDLARSLLAANLHAAHTVVVTPTTAPLFGAGGANDVVLEVPDPGPTHGAVLMVSDDSGTTTWHFSKPYLSSDDGQLTISRGGGKGRAFTVPRERLTAPSAPVAAAADASTRSIAGWIGKKVLSVLVYPIAKHAVGWVAKELARTWEKNARPYRVRLFNPDSRSAKVDGLTDAGWRTIGQGRALLFVHGILSDTAGGFGGLTNDTLAVLGNAYENRVFAFDHPTVSVDPVANAREFLDRIPSGVELDLDIVSHSRGGLVARILSGELADVPTPGVSVKKIVFAGTPNVGTPVADSTNLEELVNRFTSLLNILPPGPWSSVVAIMDGVLELVKIIGVGAIDGVPGLEAMKATSPLLTALNTGDEPATTHYAIDTNFTPTGSLISLLRVANGVADKVFDDVPNDVAVPSTGVGTVPGDFGFPVPDERRRAFGDSNIWHCSYFQEARTAASLTAWLTGN